MNNNSIHVRLNDAQFNFCREHAHTMGVSISDFMRIMINSLMVVDNKVQSVKLGDLHADETNIK